MSDFAYYIFCGIIIILAIIAIKKVAGCLLRTVLFAVAIAILIGVYFMFIK